MTAAAPAWGTTYALRIRARADFSDQLAFWETEQQYLFHPRGGEWLLFAVGSGTPPSSWKPAQPAPVAAAAPAPDALDDVKAVRDAFLASLQHFLDKQTAEASSYFTREVRILRLNVTLSRQEMAATFEGYFEGSDFSGVTPADVVDTGSIAVEPSQRFAGEHSGAAVSPERAHAHGPVREDPLLDPFPGVLLQLGGRRLEDLRHFLKARTYPQESGRQAENRAWKTVMRRHSGQARKRCS